MGWRGAVRSLASAARAAERNAQRRHAQALKSQIISNAGAAVDEWERYISELITLHTNLADSIDWKSTATLPSPTSPTPDSAHENNAKADLDNFKPGGFFAKLLGGDAKRQARLQQALMEAPAKDQAAFDKAQAKYEVDLKDWEQDTAMARRLLAGDEQAIAEVIRELQTLSKEDLIGSSVQFTIENGTLHAVPSVHSDEIIPDYRRKQLASGKLSESKMPVGQFNELYQDYVASVALKVAGDMFQMLPLDEVYVTCQTSMLNTATGRKAPMAILSVHFVRSTFKKLNLRLIDPSDSMKNFNHRMAFKKTSGFQPIEPLIALPE